MIKNYLKLLLFGFFINIGLVIQAQNTISHDSLLTSTPYLYERTDFEIDLSSSFSNPYDANEIALDMIITSPSGKSLNLPCFYVSGDGTASIWNARFAPRESGTYTCYFQLSKSAVSVATTSNKQFKVLPSAKNGFIHSNNNWNFIYDNGKPFRAIGEDVGWEARSYELQTNRYDYFLPKLAQNGANFFRTWMCNWNLPVECKTVINTNFYTNSTKYFNPGGVTRMDQLVELCDSLDMHMQLVLIPHGALITTGEWNINNYNTVNGGPASTPTEFFTLTASKNMFKNRLRYMVARWGYSPSIGAWEFFNEIDNAAFNGGGGTTNPSIPEAYITQWHTEMSTYLKSIDIYGHLETTSVSWRDITGLNSVPNIDYNQQHIYGFTGTIPSTIRTYETNWTKPYVIGEFSYDYNAPVSTNYSNFRYDLKRGLWYGLFTSTPIVPMTWWWEFFDGQGNGQDMTSYYKSVTDISNQMLLAGAGVIAPLHVSAGSLEAYAAKCGQKYFVYLLNGGTSSVTTPLSLTVSKDTTYAIKTLAPATHVYANLSYAIASSGSLNLGSVTLPTQGEIVYVISLAADSTSGVELPFSDSPVNLPGKVEAENFDKGGEGLAYHDYDAANLAGYYRPQEGVDIDTTSDGSYDVTDVVKGEWLKYTVNVSTEGSYSLDIRLAAADTGKIFRIILDNQDITGPVKVPNTGGLQNWQTITVGLSVPKLTTGPKTMKIEMESSGFAIDYLNFVLTNSAPTVSITAPSNNGSYTLPATIDITANAADADGSVAKVEFYNGSTKLGEADASPFSIQWAATVGTYKLLAIATDNSGLATISDTITGTVTNLPNIPEDTIQAENYDTGGENVGYYDLTTGNKFGFYRTDDVDIEQCTDIGGGYDLGDFTTTEWTQYTVNVTQSGTYDIDFRVASLESGTSFSLSVDGQNVTGTMTVPNTGGWQTWQTISKTGVQLTEGKHVLRLTSLANYFNTNYMMFSLSTGIKDVSQDEISCYPNPVMSTLWFNQVPGQTSKITVVNVLGKLVKTITTTDNSIDMSDLSPGVYTVSFISNKNVSVKRFKIIKE